MRIDRLGNLICNICREPQAPVGGTNMLGTCWECLRANRARHRALNAIRGEVSAILQMIPSLRN